MALIRPKRHRVKAHRPNLSSPFRHTTPSQTNERSDSGNHLDSSFIAVDVLTGEVNPFEALVGAEELIGVMEGDIVFWFVISMYHEKCT